MVRFYIIQIFVVVVFCGNICRCEIAGAGIPLRTQGSLGGVGLRAPPWSLIGVTRRALCTARSPGSPEKPDVMGVWRHLGRNNIVADSPEISPTRPRLRLDRKAPSWLRPRRVWHGHLWAGGCGQVFGCLLAKLRCAGRGCVFLPSLRKPLSAPSFLVTPGLPSGPLSRAPGPTTLTPLIVTKVKSWPSGFQKGILLASSRICCHVFLSEIFYITSRMSRLWPV